MDIEDHRRCVLCNKVSSQEIETEIGDFSQLSFNIDPHDNNRFICVECKDWHEELMMDYEKKDDPWGWEEDGIIDLIDLELECLPDTNRELHSLETLEPTNDNEVKDISNDKESI